MNIKIACPHCQVVGVVPEDLKYASNWPVACHHCHQHYYVPVVASPAPYPDKSSCVVQIVGAKLHSIRTSTNQLSGQISSVLLRLPCHPTWAAKRNCWTLSERDKLFWCQAGYWDANGARFRFFRFFYRQRIGHGSTWGLDQPGMARCNFSACPWLRYCFKLFNGCVGT